MKLLLSLSVLVAYLFFTPDYFLESVTYFFSLNESNIRMLKFLTMLGGVIVFVALTPTDRLRKPKRLDAENKPN